MSTSSPRLKYTIPRIRGSFGSWIRGTLSNGHKINSSPVLTARRTDHISFHDSSPAGSSNTLLWAVLRMRLCSDGQRDRNRDVHDLCSHPPKQAALERFGEEVRQHVCCGTILDSNLLTSNPIGDKKISNVQMTGPSST